MWRGSFSILTPASLGPHVMCIHPFSSPMSSRLGRITWQLFHVTSFHRRKNRCLFSLCWPRGRRAATVVAFRSEVCRIARYRRPRTGTSEYTPFRIARKRKYAGQREKRALLSVNRPTPYSVIRLWGFCSNISSIRSTKQWHSLGITR